MILMNMLKCRWCFYIQANQCTKYQFVNCFSVTSQQRQGVKPLLSNHLRQRIMHTVKLLSGYDMPTVGLGTWQAKPEEIESAVSTALNVGYRHIDTAFNYNNEEAIGTVLKKWFAEGGKREDLFVTSKEMEEQVRKGRARSIGLSNFNEKQILNVWENAQIKPSNLQVELHAYLQQNSLRKLCQMHNIIVTAYSPLASPGAKKHFKTKYNHNVEDFPDLLGHPIVQKISTEHKRSPAQILLRFLLQLGVVVIPKSSSPERIKANIDLFDFTLNKEEMELLKTLDKDHYGRIFNFLFFKGVEKHPHYPFKDELQS
nr:PREDICTED: alcohol dehydrogenase [NADP(+)]-like isoform X3 [Megachile rotundata]